MKFLNLPFAFIAISFAIVSQIAFDSEHKMNVRQAANYYLRKKINPSPGFSAEYTSLFLGLQRYREKDTLLANKVINRLYQVNDILFYRLMRIRLEWELKQRLVRSPLDSVRSLLKNNIDSAKYYYMLGLYFQDTLSVRLARLLGYVRATYDGNEVVDWIKMKRTNWRDGRVIESICLHPMILPPEVDCVGDSAIFYYKKAIDHDPTEFHYLKEFILFMSNLPENRDAELQQVITSKLENYTDKEKKWVKKYLDGLHKKPKNIKVDWL